ncbi:MAG: hypothetical protein EA349_08780 [Halomonadaceae bacterium]|nr:MAG: hypothetical protein EA349_08780 [Halomonadaceae bacterium]
MGGYNVVLIHGFQPDNLMSGPQNASQRQANGDQYWLDYWGARASARIDFDSNGRVQGAIASEAYAQIRQIAQNGTCAQGCIYVTHSTGDLVARYMLAHQNRWLQAEGIQPFNVIATLDLAGAGGGTDLASLAISVANNDSWTLAPAKAAVGWFLGFEPTAGNLGVINDLQPNVARNTATSANSMPRLRVVGSGSPFFGATGPFITGSDDGVVPVASACGGIAHEAVDSCVSDLAMDGERTGVSAPRGLWFNHIPLLMSDGSKHNEMLGRETGHVAVPVISQGSFGPLAVAISTREYQQRAWWQLWGQGKTYVEVPGSAGTHLSATAFGSF